MPSHPEQHWGPQSWRVNPDWSDHWKHSSRVCLGPSRMTGRVVQGFEALDEDSRRPSVPRSRENPSALFPALTTELVCPCPCRSCCWLLMCVSCVLSTAYTLAVDMNGPIKWCLCGLPWGLSGRESASRCRWCEFDPWSRKIPHALEQLSLCTTAMEPVL